MTLLTQIILTTITATITVVLGAAAVGLNDQRFSFIAVVGLVLSVEFVRDSRRRWSNVRAPSAGDAGRVHPIR